MTDKEQINDSLKNQNKNFNENFTCENRTVIIDGVDVSKCKYFEDGECGCEYYLRYGYEITMYDRCEAYPNCDYKQLQRKTAELKKYQDMEKEGLEQFKDVGGCWGCGLELTNQQLLKDYTAKTAECKKLKWQIDKVKDYVKHNMQDVDCDNWLERFIYTFEDWKKSLQNDTDHYKQALDEIEKIVQDLGAFTAYQEWQNAEILDIISKAKGEE
jgi:hypothetical protein